MEHNILTDRRGEICEKYTLLPPNKMLVSVSGKKNPIPAFGVISFIAVYALFDFWTWQTDEWQPFWLIFTTAIAFPGLWLVLFGVYGFLPSTRKDIAVEGQKERLTATVEDQFSTTTKGSDNTDHEIEYITTPYSVFAVYYNGIRYELLREGSLAHTNGRKIKVKDKIEILFDPEKPERSLLVNDVEQSKTIYGSVALILFGTVWLGMVLVSIIMDLG